MIVRDTPPSEPASDIRASPICAHVPPTFLCPQLHIDASDIEGGMGGGEGWKSPSLPNLYFQVLQITGALEDNENS